VARALGGAILAVVLLAACDRGLESGSSGPDRGGGNDGGSDLPLAPDVDPCQLPGSVVSISTGLNVGRGEFTSTDDGEGECVYAEADGDRVVLTVDTTGGAAHYDQVRNTTGGRTEIGDVGDEAFWADPQLVLLSDGRYWTCELQVAGTDQNRRQTVCIALTQQLGL
jgi:hypothetical protein